MVRGIEKRAIADDDEDREKLLRRVGRGAAATDTGIYAWALMGNHAHLLLRSGPKGLPAFMRRLLTGYAMDYNRRHSRHGHLFQNRYKSIVCEEDAYLLELVRYIHLNPLRAGLITNLDELQRYRWCGHSVLMGEGSYDWQDRNYVLAFFGRKEREAVAAYREYVTRGVSLGRRPELVGGGLIRSAGGWSQVKSQRVAEGMLSDERILGGGHFVQAVLSEAEERIRRQLPMDRRLGRAREWIDAACIQAGLSLPELQSGSRRKPVSALRQALAYRLVRKLGLPMADAARLLGVTTPAIAKSIERATKFS